MKPVYPDPFALFIDENSDAGLDYDTSASSVSYVKKKEQEKENELYEKRRTRKMRSSVKKQSGARSEGSLGKPKGKEVQTNQ